MLQPCELLLAAKSMRALQPCLTPHFQTLVQFNNHNPTLKSFKISCKLQPRPVHKHSHKAVAIASENIIIDTLIIGVPSYCIHIMLRLCMNFEYSSWSSNIGSETITLEEDVIGSVEQIDR